MGEVALAVVCSGAANSAYLLGMRLVSFVISSPGA
jgi:hypothetical protein